MDSQVNAHLPNKNELIAAVEVSAFLSTGTSDRGFYEKSFARGQKIALQNQPVGAVRGLILPHHLLAAPLIDRALRSVASTTDIQTVVIIGPDHLGRAKNPMVYSRAAWDTPFGVILPDPEFVQALSQLDFSENDERPFEEDASISALLPFVKNIFPEAKVAGVMVNDRLNSDSTERLAEKISATLRTLVIASVDFSHYLPLDAARLHDRTAASVLRTGDYDNLDSLDIDSPETLDAFLRIMEKDGAKNAEILGNMNSADFTGDLNSEETTSYVAAAFTDNEKTADGAVSLLALGDMMFDRKVRALIASHNPDYPFALIRGKEGRFFRGVDLIVGNLEGAISRRRPPEKENDFAFDGSIAYLLKQSNFTAVNLANNHSLDQGRSGREDTKAALKNAEIAFFGDQVSETGEIWQTEIRGKKVSLLGFNLTDNFFDEKIAEAAVRAAAAKSDYVVVEAHWGAEYKPLASAEQKSLGRKFIEWGASAVIGHHPHIVEGMEVWRGKPIFWSLGNFVFDQDWSEETKNGLVVGLVIKNDSTEVSLFPVKISAGQPRLLSGEAKTERLLEFVKRSNLPAELQKQAETGSLIIKSQ